MSKSKKRKKKHRSIPKAITPTGRPVAMISERIMGFANGFIMGGKDLEHKQALLNVACSASNIASTPPPKRQQLLEAFLRKHDEGYSQVSPEQHAARRSDLEKLIANKLRLYPDDRRQIISAQYSRNPDGTEMVHAAALRVE